MHLLIGNFRDTIKMECNGAGYWRNPKPAPPVALFNFAASNHTLPNFQYHLAMVPAIEEIPNWLQATLHPSTLQHLITPSQLPEHCRLHCLPISDSAAPFSLVSLNRSTCRQQLIDDRIYITSQCRRSRFLFLFPYILVFSEWVSDLTITESGVHVDDAIYSDVWYGFFFSRNRESTHEAVLS